jgi:RNA polymerase sigma-70 factor (ECF subfamily)
LSSWLFRIAHNTAIDAMRRPRLPQVPIETVASAADAPDPPPDPVEQQELGQALEAALDALRPDQRAAIVLRYEHGLPFDEIGTILGVPEVTARSHVHRARKELARLLTASGWAPSE